MSIKIGSKDSKSAKKQKSLPKWFCTSHRIRFEPKYPANWTTKLQESGYDDYVVHLNADGDLLNNNGDVIPGAQFAPSLLVVPLLPKSPGSH